MEENVIKTRGRKKGEIMGNNDTIIKDPLLEPYFIKHRKREYSLYKLENNNEKEIGHFNNMTNVLLVIIKEKMGSQNETLTLKEYSDKYFELSTNILNSIKQI